MLIELTINKIEKSDNPLVAKMIRDVFIEHNAPKVGTVYADKTTDDLFSLFHTANSVFYIAKIGEIVAGCCGIFPTEGLEEDCTELVKFYIPQEYRGIGIGKELMQKCIIFAKEKGYKKIYLESLPEFNKAVSIYEKQGFIHLNKPLGKTGHTSCNIWMIKQINN